MTEITPEQQAAIEAQLNNPEFVKAYQQALAQMPRMKSGGAQPSQLINPLLQKFGIQLPKDYEIGTGKDGKIGLSKMGFYGRNSDWIPAAVIGGAFGGSGLVGGFGAPAAASASGALPSAVTAPTVGAIPAGASSSMAAGDVAGMFTPSVAGTSAASGASNVISKLLGKVPGQDALGDAGKMFGSLENGEAANRYQKGDLTQGYDRLMLQAQQDRRANETDAMKKAQQTSYIMGGGSPYTAPKLNSGQTVDLGYGPKAPSKFEQDAAGTLQSQLLQRLSPEGSYTPTKPDYLNRGKVEKAGQAGSIISGGLGLFRDLFGK